MFSDLAEHIGVIFYILSGLVSLTVTMTFVELARTRKKANAALLAVQEVKSNYIERFERLEIILNDSHKGIIDRIHEVELKMVGEYAKRSEFKIPRRR
jgi:diphthamide synthase subunit DPH2